MPNVDVVDCRSSRSTRTMPAWRPCVLRSECDGRVHSSSSRRSFPSAHCRGNCPYGSWMVSGRVVLRSSDRTRSHTGRRDRYDGSALLAAAGAGSPSVGDRHEQCSFAKLGTEMFVHGPADDLMRGHHDRPSRSSACEATAAIPAEGGRRHRANLRRLPRT